MTDARNAAAAQKTVPRRRSGSIPFIGTRNTNDGPGTVVLPLIVWGLVYATLTCVGRPAPDTVKFAIATTIVTMACTLAGVVTGKIGSERVVRIYLPMAIAWTAILGLAYLNR